MVTLSILLLRFATRSGPRSRAAPARLSILLLRFISRHEELWSRAHEGLSILLLRFRQVPQDGAPIDTIKLSILLLRFRSDEHLVRPRHRVAFNPSLEILLEDDEYHYASSAAFNPSLEILPHAHLHEVAQRCFQSFS